MAADFNELKTTLADYTAKVDAYVAAAEQHKTDVAQAVSEAIAQDDKNEAVDLAELKATIEAAAAKMPAPPAAPVFQPSNN